MMEQLAKNEETGKGVTAKELYKKSNQIYENLNLVTQSDWLVKSPELKLNIKSSKWFKSFLVSD